MTAPRDPYRRVELDGPWEVNGWAEAAAMDLWLDNLDSLLITIHQRRMTRDQLDRYAALLSGGERDALHRQRRRATGTLRLVQSGGA